MQGATPLLGDIEATRSPPLTVDSDGMPPARKKIKWLVIGVVAVLVCVGMFFYIRDQLRKPRKGDVTRDDTVDWFDEEAKKINMTEVLAWSEEEKDEKIHKISHWSGFNATDYKGFVKEHYEPFFPIPTDKKFAFLDLGGGVGAFSRRILIDFPESSGYLVDISPSAVGIAAQLLPKDRMQTYVNSVHKMKNIPSNSVNFVFSGGVLCYLEEWTDIMQTLMEVSRTLKVGGDFSASMLPYHKSGANSCHMDRVDPSIWFDRETIWSNWEGKRFSMPGTGLHVLGVSEMDMWGFGHGYRRYCVYMKKTCQPAALFTEGVDDPATRCKPE
eukprot:GDKI01033033.1.p1 GENE.GDKI01033033.1~~GDKI01033033.1.p1  ORF type:complete len:328 (-),score=105.37 GDKI01033033.1:202-1185(-)